MGDRYKNYTEGKGLTGSQPRVEFSLSFADGKAAIVIGKKLAYCKILEKEITLACAKVG